MSRRPVHYGIGYRPEQWYDPHKGMVGQWHRTPRILFWKPAMRRLIITPWPSVAQRSAARRYFEYQHPAYVVRQILEERFGTET